MPLFQEQVMQMAVVAAGFTPVEADKLRRAMSSKRFDERISELREKLMAGMAERGIPDDTAEDIYVKLEAFSSYGFPVHPPHNRCREACARRRPARRNDRRAVHPQRGAQVRALSAVIVEMSLEADEHSNVVAFRIPQRSDQ